MADYTLKNLKRDVDDAAEKFGLAPNLEARFARDALGSTRSGLGYEPLAPDLRGRVGHKHREQEEVYVLVSGSARVKVEDEVVELEQWDALRVPQDTMRCFEAGPEGAEILALRAPTTGSNDAEIDPGWWRD